MKYILNLKYLIFKIDKIYLLCSLFFSLYFKINSESIKYCSLQDKGAFHFSLFLIIKFLLIKYNLLTRKSYKMKINI